MRFLLTALTVMFAVNCVVSGAVSQPFVFAVNCVVSGAVNQPFTHDLVTCLGLLQKIVWDCYRRAFVTATEVCL